MSTALKFQDFLEENDIKEIFLNAVKAEGEDAIEIYKDCIFGNSDYKITNITKACFSWHQTPQGFDFWQEINRKWINICFVEEMRNHFKQMILAC